MQKSCLLLILATLAAASWNDAASAQQAGNARITVQRAHRTKSAGESNAPGRTWISLQRLQTPSRKITVFNGRNNTVSGANPVAHGIDFHIIRRDTKFRGSVRITGVVKNTGNAQFQGRNSEARLMSGNRVLARATFSSLRPGQEMRVHYVRNWNSASPSEGEFPSTYTLKIVYDTDDVLGGPNNDVSLNDNQRSRSGSDINKLFRGRTRPSRIPLPSGPPPVLAPLR
jgi:hypothetical protein